MQAQPYPSRNNFHVPDSGYIWFHQLLSQSLCPQSRLGKTGEGNDVSVVCSQKNSRGQLFFCNSQEKCIGMCSFAILVKKKVQAYIFFLLRFRMKNIGFYSFVSPMKSVGTFSFVISVNEKCWTVVFCDEGAGKSLHPMIVFESVGIWSVTLSAAVGK